MSRTIENQNAEAVDLDRLVRLEAKARKAEKDYERALAECIPIGTNASIQYCGYTRTGKIAGHRGMELLFRDGKKSDTWVTYDFVTILPNA